MFRTSFRWLFAPNRNRQERLNSLSHALEHGTEEIGWGVPAAKPEGLVNEFRQYRREKRGCLSNTSRSAIISSQHDRDAAAGMHHDAGGDGDVLGHDFCSVADASA